MKKITQEELKVFLRKHKLWLANDPDGDRANLRGANLRGADLRGADLRGADLRGADLRGADLRGANLLGADLRGANLYGADLNGANLYGANLNGANLYGANLCGADLRGSDLRGSDLNGANLCGADLRGAMNVDCPIACPEKGSFIGFKKVRDDYIVELEILETALRNSATSRKCRCSEARVLSITKLDGSATDIKSACSKWDEHFVYTVGEVVKVDNFDTDRWNECAPGIHFFITRQEAVEY